MSGSPRWYVFWHCQENTMHQTQITACRTQSIPPSVFVLAENSFGAFQVPQQINNPHSNAGDVGSIPGSGRSPGEGNGNPLQYSCLGNPMDRGVWWATVHGVPKESDMTEKLNNNTTIQQQFLHFQWLKNI